MARPTDPTPKRMGTIREGALEHKVSEKTVRRRIADGSITGYRFGPRVIRIDLNELEQLLRPMPAVGQDQVA